MTMEQTAPTNSEKESSLEQIEEQLFKLNDLWRAVLVAQCGNDWQTVKTAQREADEAEGKWKKMMQDYYGPRYRQRSESDGTDEGTEVAARPSTA